jgi:NADH-quinone oxidoreductase subunit J
MTINIILLVAFIMAAVWTVMTTRLPRSAVGLAITSAILTIIMFRLASPLAAVFELSVCAGLISAIFISIISLMRRVTAEDRAVRQKEHFHKYWLLPIIIGLVIIGLAAVALSQLHLPADFNLPAKPMENDVRIILWNLRHLDLLGQIVILLAGAFGVAALFKEWKNE